MVHEAKDRAALEPIPPFPGRIFCLKLHFKTDVNIISTPVENRKSTKKIRRFPVIVLIFAAEIESIAMKKNLTAKEEELMNIFWAHGPMFIRDVVSRLPEPKPHYNTVATLVKFLDEKGFLEREPMANSFRYRVKISERQYHGDTVSEVVARYYDNSYLNLVSQFVEEDKMDIQELKDLIAQIEKKQP